MVESLLRGREVLYIAKQDGCQACMVADAELAIFERAHPSVMVLRIDANGPIPERLGMSIKATPTYGFRRDDTMVLRVGVLKAKEVERWLRTLEARL